MAGFFFFFFFFNPLPGSSHLQPPNLWLRLVLSHLAGPCGTVHHFLWETSMPCLQSSTSAVCLVYFEPNVRKKKKNGIEIQVFKMFVFPHAPLLLKSRCCSFVQCGYQQIERCNLCLYVRGGRAAASVLLPLIGPQVCVTVL